MKVFFAIGLLFFLGTTCLGNESRTIIKDGKALAVIVIPGKENLNPDGEEEESSDKLGDQSDSI